MKGHLHPLTHFIRISVDFFSRYGFSIFEGPEIENEWNNFDALNVPAEHPARDLQDTFWLKDGRLLRTHTTATDIRIIKSQKLRPPFYIIIPGRCFRNEATDQIHEHTFYQIDGIAVDKNLNIGHLIGLLDAYMKKLFGKETKTRIRPHFYPFVEPGLDMDAFVGSQWREMLGAGMAHPKVLKNCAIDPEKWQGIMWGLGIDRYAMQYFGIPDIRLSYSGDLRFLKQF